jgi:hypothetical protein
LSKFLSGNLFMPKHEHNNRYDSFRVFSFYSPHFLNDYRILDKNLSRSCCKIQLQLLAGKLKDLHRR